MKFQDDDQKQRGIDYDLEACLEYNPQEGFTIDDIKKVLAVWEGQNDEADWHWALRLNDGRAVYLRGGCDYTGWDCRSEARHVVLSGDTTLTMAMDMLRNYSADSELYEVFVSLGQQVSGLTAATSPTDD